MPKGTVYGSSGPPAICACGRRYQASGVTAGGKGRTKQQRRCPQCTKDEKLAKQLKKLQKD
jgi:hypothetical protein